MCWIVALALCAALIWGGLDAADPQSSPVAAAQDATPSVADDLEQQPDFEGPVAMLTPVLVSLIGSDTAAVRGSDGRYHVVYELLLTNFSSGPADLEAITILDAADGREILRVTGEELIAGAALRTLSRRPAEDTMIPQDGARVLLLTTSFAARDEVPAALDHRIDVLAPSFFTTDAVSYGYVAGSLELARRTPPVLSPPLTGEGWIAAEGCCDPASHHRAGVFPVNDALNVEQRFAIDWVRIDDEGRLVTDDPRDITNWVGYGAPVLAAADGVVIATADGAPDNVPGELPDVSALTLDEFGGNQVFIDHGDGFYSGYVHLQPGSVAVAVGDRVQTGDQLGLLGNSGASEAPHLHFDLVDGPSPSAADGFPYIFDAFDLAGHADPSILEAALRAPFKTLSGGH